MEKKYDNITTLTVFGADQQNRKTFFLLPKYYFSHC